MRPHTVVRELDPHGEPLADGEARRVPEPVAVVELPRGEAVEDGCVLDRVGIADLVRPHEERLVVRLVGDAPGDAVERPLRRHREVGFEHPVLERHAVRAREHACAGEADGGAPGELGLGALDTAPLPRVQLERVDRLHQRQRSAVAARSDECSAARRLDAACRGQRARQLTRQAGVRDERCEVRAEAARVERVRPVEADRGPAPKRVPPRLPRGQEQRVRRPRGVAVVAHHVGEDGEALSLGPDGQHRRPRAVRAGFVCPALRPLDQVDAALGQRRRPLLQHDHVEAARAQRGERDAVRPVILERVAAGRDRLHVDRRVPDAACDRGDGRGQVVRRRQAVADEEHAQVPLLRACAACRDTRQQHDEQRGERFHSAQRAASSTIVAAASPMSCTQHHSRSEW